MKKRISYTVKYPNVHLDISGHAPDRWGMLRYAIDTAGKDKFLFGSDFPICNPAVYMAIVDSELLSPEEKQAVFSGNFKRLTGL
ncbi:MAG: Amidohydrolase [Lentisphaerae bacterium ADurb.Bin242]|nr:MAG: Amidohydrolase [Lentisphaerae bacterium ADurb.Bin242]